MLDDISGHLSDPLAAAILTAGASVGAAGAVVAQSAVTDGIDPTTGWAGGIIVGGVGVFGFWYRYWVKREKQVDKLRRDVDGERTQRILNLERTVGELNQTILDMHQRYETALETRIASMLDPDSASG